MSTASCFSFIIIVLISSVYSYTDEEIAQFEAFYEYLGSNGTFRDTEMELRGTEIPVTSYYEFPFVASLQRAPGYGPIGLPTVYVTPQHVLSITLYAEALRFNFLRKKDLVVVSSNELTPGTTGKIKKVIAIIGDTTGFAMLKIQGSFKPFARLPNKHYRFSRFDNLTIVKWKGITNSLVKIDGVKYNGDDPCTILGVPVPSYMGCLSQENLFLTDGCAPVFNRRKQLVGMVAIPSLGIVGSEYIYKIADILDYMIAIAKGTPRP